MSKNIFISWSSADQCIKDIAEGYKNWLNIIFDDKIEIFFSEEIEPAQNGIKQIHAALDKADVGLVFVTQRTACSPWVMYEFGCMYKLLEQEALYPILLDLDCKKLKEIAPPMADTQVVSLNNKDDNMHLIESIAKKLEISGSDILKIKNKAKAEYRHIDECVTEAQKNFANLPDTYVGEVPYNDTIMGSNNFQMPQIFDFYKKNIF